MSKNFSYIVCFLLCAHTAFGQLARQYSFTHYSTANGLPSNTVNDILQDYNGYMWFATVNGLQRFDGNKFLGFYNEEGNASSIPHDNVSKIYEDREKNLWVSTLDNKIGIFNTLNYTYREVSIRLRKALTAFQHKTFYETSDQLLLLHIGGDGFYIYDKIHKVFKPDNAIMPLPKGWALHSIHYQKTGNRYLMACDSGLVVYNYANKTLNYRDHNPDNENLINLFGDRLHTLGAFTDMRERLFFVTWLPGHGAPELHYYNKATGEVKKYNIGDVLKSYHEIQGHLQQQNGRIWIYGRPFIVEFTGGSDPFQLIRNEYRDEQSIKFDIVYYMYEDRQRNLWIATQNGVFLFNPDAQLFYGYNLVRPNGKGVVEGPVRAALQLKNGQIWIGCWGMGLYFYDNNFTPLPVPEGLKKYQDNISPWCMLQHSKTGKIWMGLQAGQILVYDTALDKVEIFAPPVFEGRTIRQVTEDNEGNLWFGSHSGHLVKWDSKSANEDFKKGFSLVARVGLVHKLITDNKGYVWIASLGDAVYQVDPSLNKIIREIRINGNPGEGLAGETVNDIIQYNDSLMIISSGPIDILNTNTNRLTHITSKEGLPSNTVLCLEKDQTGVLWIGVINGLSRMNLQKGIFTTYDRRDGMPDDYFKVAGAYRIADGRMVFMTDHNFIVFDPRRMLQSMIPANIRLTEIKLSNISLNIDSITKLNKAILGHDQNSISIEFSAMSYLKQNKIIHYHMLEGLDKEWIQSDERHQAVYNYLAPGDYVFKVRSENADGIPSTEITTLAFKIEPPFWKAWWFYGILAMMIVAVFYWVDKERVRRIMAMHQVRTQIAGNLHEDINTTLNNINLLSELAKIKADKDITKSKEFIDQIHEKSRRMIDAMDDMLWCIHPENDSMHKTLERMAEFVQGLQTTHGIDIGMIVDDKVKSLQLDMKTRHEIFLIFKEALNNIACHAGCTNTSITIEFARSVLSINIQDNGDAYDIHSAGETIAYNEIRKRAEILNAELDIQSDKNGTAIMLRVPIRKKGPSVYNRKT